MIASSFIETITTDNNSFLAFSLEHFTVLGLAFIILCTTVWFAKNRLNEKQQYWLGNSMAIIILLTLIAWTTIQISIGRFNIQEDLPLALCNFMAITIVFVMFSKNRFWMEVHYFWILAGTMQANLTPHLYNSFPHYHFIKFWIIHLGLVVTILYATIIYKNPPTFKGIFKAILALQPYVIFCIIVNYLIGANYLYLNAKPPTASIVDSFGPWPIYILVAYLLMFPFFLIVYLPYFFINRSVKASN